MARDGELVELTRAVNEPMAGLVVAALEREGIPSLVQGAFVGNLGLFGALGGVPKVMVRPDDLARARLVLDALEGRMTDHDDAADEDGSEDGSEDGDEALFAEDDDFGEEDEVPRPQ